MAFSDGDSGTAHLKMPVEWRFVEALPMTASGKVRKADLPELFE